MHWLGRLMGVFQKICEVWGEFLVSLWQQLELLAPHQGVEELLPSSHLAQDSSPCLHKAERNRGAGVLKAKLEATLAVDPWISYPPTMILLQSERSPWKCSPSVLSQEACTLGWGWLLMVPQGRDAFCGLRSPSRTSGAWLFGSMVPGESHRHVWILHSPAIGLAFSHLTC